MSNSNQINCPNCGTAIDVQDILSHQLEEEIKQKYQSQLQAEQDKFKSQQAALAKDQEAFEEKKRKENELFKERLEKELSQRAKEAEAKLKAKLATEQQEQYDALQKELNEKTEQVKELNRSKVEIERLKREKEEAAEQAELKAQKMLNELLGQEREKIAKTEAEKNELRIKEMEKKLQDQIKLTEEMQRKQAQGSMQLQGEVQELAIEEYLAATFPLDTIEEIKKGARGADCIQVVNTRTTQNCGKVYYESKRTKDFQAGWIEKFKADMRDKEADVGVLVTEAMPADMERMGLRDGVWVCSFAEFKGLCAVLRESVVQINKVALSQEGKGDKMSLLYDFLTSNTFRMQVEAIVEGFSQMKNDLETEKRSMQRIWKQREKQIDKVVTNTIDMYGSIKGIAGSAVQSVKALELDQGFLEEGEE